MSRNLLSCFALPTIAALSIAGGTPALAAVSMDAPCGTPLGSELAEARASLHETLASQPEQAPRLQAALAHLALLHDHARSARHIQGGVLSADQRERLSRRIAATTAATR